MGGVIALLAMAGPSHAVGDPVRYGTRATFATHTPRVGIRARVGRQRIRVGRRTLYRSFSSPPFVKRARNASSVLANAFGPPTRCRPTDPWSAGRPAWIAVYPARAGMRARAVLEPASGAQSAGPEVCRAGSMSSLLELTLRGTGRIRTDRGWLTLGEPLRAQPLGLGVWPRSVWGEIQLPVQDPCRHRVTAAQLGSQNSLIFMHGDLTERVAAVELHPANPGHCLSAPTRTAFDRTVRADACSLFGAPGEGRTRAGRCEHHKLAATARSSGTPVTISVGKPLASGTSTDGTVSWRYDSHAGVVEGRGLAIDLKAVGSSFDPDDEGTFHDAADRIATGLPFAAQPFDHMAYLTALLRVAHPRLTNAVVGAPVVGADSVATSVFVNRVLRGYAVFDYKPVYTWNFHSFSPTIAALCRADGQRYFWGCSS